MVDTLRSEIEDCIEQQDWPGLRARLEELDIPQIADLIGDLESPLPAFVFRLLPRERAAMVFAELEAGRQKALLHDLTDEEVRRLLAGLRPDDRTQLLEDMPGRVTQYLLNLLSPEDLRATSQFLGFPEQSVGRLMIPDYVAVRPEWTVGEALRHVREKARSLESVSVIYVVDAGWKLIDAVELQRFVLADPEQLVETVMDYTYVALPAAADREEAVDVMRRYDLFELPIVDDDGVLLGVVTVDDVLDVAQQEATEDFHRVAAVRPLETGYREASVWALYQRRAPWLVGLVALNIVSSGIIAAYEETLASVIALAFFIPLLIDSGGNTGSQAAMLATRAIATRDVTIAQWGRVLGKELAVGVTLGVTLAVASGLLGILRGGSEVGIVVALAMVAIIITANILGAALPFLLTRLRLDPAAASAPLVTSMADMTGLFLYLTIATLIIDV